jgi:hypothetical protein
MDKITYAEHLVDTLLLEQQFSVSVALSNLKGAAEVEWTNCHNRKCRIITDRYTRDECKLDCQRRAYSNLITKLGGVRGRCSNEKDPGSCVKTVSDTIKAFREKVDEIRANILKVRQAKAVQQAAQAGRARR